MTDGPCEDACPGSDPCRLLPDADGDHWHWTDAGDDDDDDQADPGRTWLAET